MKRAGPRHPRCAARLPSRSKKAGEWRTIVERAHRHREESSDIDNFGMSQSELTTGVTLAARDALTPETPRQVPGRRGLLKIIGGGW